MFIPLKGVLHRMTGSDKTEKPTPKRLADAREKGQVVRSPDFTSGLVLAVGSIIIATLGHFWGQTLSRLMTDTLESLARPHAISITTVLNLVMHLGQAVLALMVPFLGGLLVVSAGSHLAVTGLLWSTHSLMPDFSKLNPLSGVQRLFSLQKLVELAKSLLKFGLVASVVWLFIQGTTEQLQTWQLLPLEQVYLQGIWPKLSQMMIWTSVAMIVIGVIDWRFNAWQYTKKLMMSRQEVIDEHKNQDGDPKMKAKQRRMGRQIVEKRQLASVPKADVVINNPTHFSVAIQYDPDLSPAPRVIAKGQDFFALKIRETAKQHGVPMVENKPLAQSLYKTVEVDQMIPPELFVAVAEVLAYVYAQNKGRRPKR